MRRYYQVASIVILLLGVYVMVESRTTIPYYSQHGPGPGFMPFWCGFILAVSAAAWFLQVTFRPVESMPKDFYPDRAGALRILPVIAALLLLAYFMTILGFQLALLLFLLFLLLIVGEQKPIWAVVYAVVGSWAITYCFRNLLDVPLPMSAFEVLNNIGL